MREYLILGSASIAIKKKFFLLFNVSTSPIDLMLSIIAFLLDLRASVYNFSTMYAVPYFSLAH